MHLLESYFIFYLFFFYFFFSTFIYFWDRERQSMNGGGAEREGGKQAPGSEPSAQSPTRGSNSRTGRSWPGWSRTLNRLRHPGAPWFNSVFMAFLSRSFRQVRSHISQWNLLPDQGRRKQLYYHFCFLRDPSRHTDQDSIRLGCGSDIRDSDLWQEISITACFFSTVPFPQQQTSFFIYFAKSVHRV